MKKNHSEIRSNLSRILVCLLLIAFLGSIARAGGRLVPTSPLYERVSEQDQFLLKHLLVGGDDPWGTQFYYLAQPSFDTEFALSADTAGTLHYAKFDLNTYGDMPSQQHKVSMTTSDLHVPDSIMKALYRLVESSVQASSFLFERLGCDGTTYTFGTRSIAAYCWSPKDGKCRELVRFWDRCCAAVQAQRLDSLQALMPQCRTLTISFRKDFPADFFDIKTNDNFAEFHKQYIGLRSNYIVIEWPDTSEPDTTEYIIDMSMEDDSLQDLTIKDSPAYALRDAFKAKQGDELIEFSRFLYCEHLVDTYISLETDGSNHIDFNALRQEFLNDPEAFVKKYDAGRALSSADSVNHKSIKHILLYVLGACCLMILIFILGKRLRSRSQR